LAAEAVARAKSSLSAAGLQPSALCELADFVLERDS